MRILALLLLLPFAASAQTRPVQLTYEAYVAGLSVFSIKADVALASGEYRVEVGYQTHGLVGLFFHADMHSIAQGRFQGPEPLPQRFTSWGAFRGSGRQTLIDYPAGTPLVRVLEPPAHLEREPVPPDQTLGTIDTLSALAKLVHAVTETGRCEGDVRVFDGRRLSDITARTGEKETLAADKGSVFAGPAQRCDFSGRMLAGFLFAEDRQRQAEPQEGATWLAAPAGGLPVIPVRIRFHLPLFGAVTAYLTEVKALP
jgi:hypothetical protein